MNIFDRQKRIARYWDEYRSDFLKLYSLEQSAKVNINHLEKSFVDLQGKQYYTFPDALPLPTERYGKLIKFLTYFDGGFSQRELLIVADEMDKAFVAAAKNINNLSKVGFWIAELKSRMTMVMHTELLYHIVAIATIREDESPEIFSERIQDEKVAAFKAFAAERGSYFFFQNFPLKNLKRLKEMSEKEWTVYWQESLIQQEKLIVQVKTLSSELELTKSKETST